MTDVQEVVGQGRGGGFISLSVTFMTNLLEGEGRWEGFKPRATTGWIQ